MSRLDALLTKVDNTLKAWERTKALHNLDAPLIAYGHRVLAESQQNRGKQEHND